MSCIFLIFLMMPGLSGNIGGQQITLEECRQKAQDNYPLIVQYDLLEKTKAYNLNNASKGYWPQLTLSGKASYQSDVTELPAAMAGVVGQTIKGQPKDQYQVMVELQQHIWDGGEIRQQRNRIKAYNAVERSRIDADMYALHERVNQVYFGVLLIDEQLKQNTLLQEDLERSYQQVLSYIANGIAGSTDLNAVQVEQLNVRQKEIELTSSRVAYVQMLSLLIGEEIDGSIKLQKPVSTDAPHAAAINRPELWWFDAQSASLDVEKEMLHVRNLPRFGLFVQGAYGNPGLNMLKDEFTPYYIAGVRLTWKFGGLYTLRNDKRIIENQRSTLQSNRDVFLFNTRLLAIQDDNAIQSLRKLMREDERILALRQNIRKGAEAKVANGTSTVVEMLREITAENLARQTKAIHEIQLLMHIYQWKYTTNN